VLNRKFIAISAYIKKKKREPSQINNLMMLLKLLEKQEETKPKTSRWREITKIRSKIDEIKTKQTIQRINETKNQFLKRLTRLTNP
jgi:hypothetical protein